MLAVRVSNHPQDTVDALPSGAGKQLYRAYGGIYRKVWLLRTRAAHFDPLDHGSSGVYVTPVERDVRRGRPCGARPPAQCVAGRAHAACSVARLTDADDRPSTGREQTIDVPAGAVAEASVQGRIASPRLWSPRTPYLYRLHAELWDGAPAWWTPSPSARGSATSGCATARSCSTASPSCCAVSAGTRRPSTTAAAVTDDELREDFANPKDLGVNFVRLAHYPHARPRVRPGGRAGPAGLGRERAFQLVEGRRGLGETITREMVRQNYNHPSIVMWSVGNEAASSRVNPSPPP